MSLSFGHSVEGHSFDVESGSTTTIFELRVDAGFGKGDDTFSIVSRFLVVYSSIRCPREDAVRAFCSQVGLFAVYPYFRTHVSHLSWQAHVPLPVLPVLRQDRGRPANNSDKPERQESAKKKAPSRKAVADSDGPKRSSSKKKSSSKK